MTARPSQRASQPVSTGRPGRAPLLALLVLVALLGLALAALVPWTVLPDADLRPDLTLDFSPTQVAREVAFHDAARWASYGGLTVSLVVAGLLGLTRAGGRLVQVVASPFGGRWSTQVGLGTLAVLTVGRLATLPLSARVEAARRSYGLSTSSWGSWAFDVLRGLLVDAALSALALLVLVALARRAGRAWWAWAAAATAALVIGGSFAYPVVVEPVFNNFRPMAQGPLRGDLLALADRDGVPVREVLVADASRRTTALNAYVSGFGSSRRIVVYDTLLARASPPEVELVVAHELGHAKRQDVLTGTLLGALAAAAGVCGLALLLRWSPLLRRAGADGPHDPRIIALLLLLVSVGTLVSAPATNLVSRRIEARADVHALDLTEDPVTFAAAQRRLALANLSDLEPNPLSYALFATHPGAADRLALARAWQQQQQQQQGQGRRQGQQPLQEQR